MEVGTLNLTEENIANSQLFKELMSTVTTGSEIPFVLKDQVIMAPGVWNDIYYSKEEILKAYKDTDWEDRYNSNLILDHENEKFGEWVGQVENRKINESTGYVYGDLYVYDPITAIKLKYGKPKSGVSPRVFGREEEKAMKDFKFNNFAIVINPAVKKAFINNSDGSKPVFFSEGGVVMSEQVKESKEDSKAVANTTEAPAKLSELEEFTQFHAEYVKENKEASLEEVFNAFKKKKMPEAPAPVEAPVKEKKEDLPKPEEEMKAEKGSSELEELKTVVKEMAQSIKELKDKYETPEKVTVSGTVAELSQNQSADEQMMSFLKRM